MTTLRSLVALFLVALLFTGCGGLDQAAQRDLDQAAVDLGDQLDAPGLLAATALLYHEVNGRYPATPFDLLGSTAARETGLQRLGLSALDLAPEGDGLQMRYTLLPSAADPSDRFGTVTVAETDTVGTYDVGLLLERIADPDFSSRSLPAHGAGALRRRPGAGLALRRSGDGARAYAIGRGRRAAAARSGQGVHRHLHLGQRRGFGNRP